MTVTKLSSSHRHDDDDIASGEKKCQENAVLPLSTSPDSLALPFAANLAAGAIAGISEISRDSHILCSR